MRQHLLNQILRYYYPSLLFCYLMTIDVSAVYIIIYMRGIEVFVYNLAMKLVECRLWLQKRTLVYSRIRVA